MDIERIVTHLDLRPRTFALTTTWTVADPGLCDIVDTQDFCIDADDATTRVAGLVRLQRTVADAAVPHKNQDFCTVAAGLLHLERH